MNPKKETPQKRIEYKRVVKFFYSFKYNCWFEKTKIVLRNDSKGGYWFCSMLINEKTKEILEEINGKNQTDLSERILSFVNDKKNF